MVFLLIKRYLFTGLTENFMLLFIKFELKLCMIICYID